MSDVVKCSCGFDNHPSCSFCIKCGETLPGVEAGRERPVRALGAEPPRSADRPQQGTEDVINRLIEQAGYKKKKTRAGWKLTVPLGERKQEVHLLFDGKDSEGHDVVAFLSVCAPAQESRAMAVLARNSKLLHCAFAVRKFNKRQYFVVTASQLAATADDDEMHKKLHAVAQNADRLQQALTTKKETA